MNRLGLLFVTFLVAVTSGFGSSEPAVIKGYTVFANSEQATKWYATYRPIMTLALGSDSGNVIPPSDSRYAVLNEMVAKLWPAFQARFPKNVEGVPAPIILLLENKTPNAFATYDRTKNVDPNVFFVLSGLIEENFKNKEGVLGVIAHELAHHVLGHAVPGVSEKVDKYYVAGENEPLGLLQKNDEAVKRVAAKWIEAAKMVGPFSYPELRGFPMPGIGYPMLYTLINALATPHAEREACGKMNAAVSQALTSVAGRLTASTHELIVTDKEKLRQLAEAGQEYLKQAQICLAGETRSLLQVVVSLFNIPEEDALKGNQFSPTQLALFKQEGNTAAALIKLAETFSDDKEELARQIDLSKVRNYSIEEQADDVAIEVLRNVKSSAKPLIEFFKASIPSHEITGCLATVASDRVPGYGVLSDNHHSTCYRIYHAQKFEAYLESQK